MLPKKLNNHGFFEYGAWCVRSQEPDLHNVILCRKLALHSLVKFGFIIISMNVLNCWFQRFLIFVQMFSGEHVRWNPTWHCLRRSVFGESRLRPVQNVQSLSGQVPCTLQWCQGIIFNWRENGIFIIGISNQIKKNLQKTFIYLFILLWIVITYSCFIWIYFTCTTSKYVPTEYYFIRMLWIFKW